MKPLFQGVCTALITPFRLDFVHMEVYDQLLDRQLKAGVTALVVCGTTGESATMTDTEKLDLIGHTVDYVQGRARCWPVQAPTAPPTPSPSAKRRKS